MLLTISVTVIAAAIVVFTLFLIPVLLQIRRTSRGLEKLVDSARMQVVPLSHDLTTISLEAKGVLQSIHRQVDMVEDGITTVRDAALSLRDFQEEVQRNIEGPLLELASLIRVVSRGVEAFLKIFRH